MGRIINNIVVLAVAAMVIGYLVFQKTPIEVWNFLVAYMKSFIDFMKSVFHA